MNLDNYIAEEIAKYKGIGFPVKSSVLRRLIVSTEKCKNLHPNPDDEFSKPEIGPSYRIISEYEKKYKDNPLQQSNEEPIIVEKMHPEGYMIVNGHHRWAAHLRLGIKKANVRVVNLTHENDIRQMLYNCKHDKRVTMDLDEVIFGKEGEDQLENKLPFPFCYEYKERMRSGVPALIKHLKRSGYDVWVYSSNYYSMDYLKQLFKKYHVILDGVVTGTAKRSKEAKGNIDKLFAEKYITTVLVDRGAVIKTVIGSKEYEEREIDEESSNWSNEVMKIFDEFEKEDSDQ